MVGFVTTRSLLAHPSLIVREFGVHCFARCIWRTMTLGRNVTFLECIPFSASSPASASVTRETQVVKTLPLPERSTLCANTA